MQQLLEQVPLHAALPPAGCMILFTLHVTASLSASQLATLHRPPGELQRMLEAVPYLLQGAHSWCCLSSSPATVSSSSQASLTFDTNTAGPAQLHVTLDM